MCCILVTQKIECLSQWPAPFLVPTRPATSMTPTITNPPADTVWATPRGAFTGGPVIEFDLEGGLMVVEILAVVCDLKAACGCIEFQSMRQTDIAKFEVMTVGFAVSRDVHHFAAVYRLDESIKQFPTRLQKILKSDRT